MQTVQTAVGKTIKFWWKIIAFADAQTANIRKLK